MSDMTSTTTARASRWDLDRLLVAAAALSVFLGAFAFAGWSPAEFVGAVPIFFPAIPGWIFAFLLALYARPWVYLAAGILNALLPLFALFVMGAAPSLADPLGGGEHQALVLMLLGLVLALAGGIGGFVRARRGTTTPLAGAGRTRRGRASILGAVFVLGVLVTSGLAGSAAKEMATSGGSYNVVPDERILVSAVDFRFAPRAIEIPAGKLVEIRIENKDTVPHTFTYHAGTRLHDTFLPAGATVNVLVRFDAPQTIHFWCEPHSSGAGDRSPDSMVGTMSVR